ncbi:Cof-type HAD-IIB family hydrolase [Brevibacillus sp. SYP-B805]|uniref:Cof-type HAD-IIB family hydrolase n=1 Tax=Brevibacillus sp. SYP-B805 TaxID=1578199 RepID=UPI0013E9DD0B|nr:Cof-type HAD-IIB family hydrolase [Brevibacillus sp. SYP-B805]NGQ95144.1 Cof-type HAD-IIB family hydrolase [Brevibacillus sp. SYP-B805]
MSAKIVFFDVDGTLLNDNKQLPADAKEAVRLLKAQGIRTAIATGRAPYHLKDLAAELGIDTYVSFNGSYVVCEGKVIYEDTLKTETLAEIEAMADARSHPLVFLNAEEFSSNRDNHPYVLDAFSHLKLAIPPYDPDFYRKKTVHQGFLCCPEGEEKDFVDTFADVSFVRWHPYAMDILPRNGSKARGIEALLHHLGIAAADAVAFGDGRNDKEMLAFVGIGIAMGNAHEELKPYADLMTKHVDEGGIRHGLEMIGLL